jgi:GNAT superfamily N-acetyltransferase
MNIRLLELSDIPIMVHAFAASHWTEKPANVFQHYLQEQKEHKRACWVAFEAKQFAGYVTLKWQSNYAHFAKDNRPEISDLNVLPAFRNRGIGFALIERCEALAATQSDIVGIGVGLYSDYGSAQRLYIKRGYIPDGHGATYDCQAVVPGERYPMDDDLCLWFTKHLTQGK